MECKEKVWTDFVLRASGLKRRGLLTGGSLSGAYCTFSAGKFDDSEENTFKRIQKKYFHGLTASGVCGGCTFCMCFNRSSSFISKHSKWGMKFVLLALRMYGVSFYIFRKYPNKHISSSHCNVKAPPAVLSLVVTQRATRKFCVETLWAISGRLLYKASLSHIP